jgi:hypothetical protein
MLPAVSCDDCLFADLGIDPARDGCQMYEATNFLLCRRSFDIRAGLILWQVGLLGQADYRLHFSRAGLPLLVEVLAAAYGPAHVVTLYLAAVYAVFRPLIRRVELVELPETEVCSATTLYVPPLRRAEPDLELSTRLSTRLRA